MDTNFESKLLFEDVRHVPDIHLNLIFIGILDDRSFTSYFSKIKWKFTKDSLAVAREKKMATLYFTQVKLDMVEMISIQKNASIDMVHEAWPHQ